MSWAFHDGHTMAQSAKDDVEFIGVVDGHGISTAWGPFVISAKRKCADAYQGTGVTEYLPEAQE